MCVCVCAAGRLAPTRTTSDVRARCPGPAASLITFYMFYAFCLLLSMFESCAHVPIPTIRVITTPYSAGRRKRATEPK